MINVTDLQLLTDIAIVSQYPVLVPELTEGGIKKTKEQINSDKSLKQYRIGKIINITSLSDELLKRLNYIFIKGKKVEKLEDLIGVDIIYLKHSAEVALDFPIYYNETDISINAIPINLNYIIAFYEEK